MTRPDLVHYVENSARERGLPVVIATTAELVSIADGNPHVLATVDGVEVCVKLASPEELSAAIDRARAGDESGSLPPKPDADQLAKLVEPISAVMRRYPLGGPRVF